MMLVNPLWLISLISLIILLLIYILKPNFQQKFVSSTFIWKLSLKYKKKKLPTNKLKNILLIICQVLTLVVLTGILVKPIVKYDVEDEVVLVIDASASMRTMLDDESRFSIACDKAREKANQVFDKGGIVSVVVASPNPYFLAQRATEDTRYDVDKQLADFKNTECGYGKSSLDDATMLCSDILLANPETDIFYYTDTEVSFIKENMTVVDCKQGGEFNVALTKAYTEIIDNYYAFVVEVVCYGRNESVELCLEVYSANKTEAYPNGMDYTFKQVVDLDNDSVKKVVFASETADLGQILDDSSVLVKIPDTSRIFSFESVHTYVDVDDCFYEDNSYDIYGGTKELLKVLYATDEPNPFFGSMILTMASVLNDRFEIVLTDFKDKTAEVPNVGYDLYIYEHNMMPATAPTDGVVLYHDPLINVANGGFVLRNKIDYHGVSMPLTEVNQHPIHDNCVAENITLSQLTTFSSIDSTYTSLWELDGKPAILIDDSDQRKSILWAFSFHYSNLPITIEFPLMIYNLFDYFMPSTLEGNLYEVDENITVRSRSDELTISGNGKTYKTDKHSDVVSFELPGTYKITQTTFFGKDLTEYVYVQVPESESNIFEVIDSINSPVVESSNIMMYKDFFFYLACALTFLVFVEWILKGKDQI